MVGSPEELGAAVAYIRRKQGLSIDRAAGLSGVTKQTLMALERGSRSIRHIDMLRILGTLTIDVALIPRVLTHSLHPDAPE
ncbi:MAG TPA: helix-turn-helix domain-containing protein [Gemmatimonadaceae bacterium]|nr:helix-turn-helix domain-containing protein [Gemmatimonadaceae bacterium]